MTAKPTQPGLAISSLLMLYRESVPSSLRLCAVFADVVSLSCLALTVAMARDRRSGFSGETAMTHFVGNGDPFV